MIYLTSLHFILKILIGSAYIMPYVRKQKHKCQHWDICYKSWKIRQVILKKVLLLWDYWSWCYPSPLAFKKIKLLYRSSLYPPITYHVRIFFDQSNFLLCRISQFSQEITLRQIINSLLSPLTNRYCCKVKRKIGL